MQDIKQVLEKIRGFLWPFMLIVVGCMLIRISFSKIEIYFFINQHHIPFWDKWFPRITFLGSSTFASYFTLFVALFIGYRQAFLFGSSYLLTAAINFPLKYLFYSPRPSLFFQGMHKDLYFIPGIEILENNYSFPSGHTVCIFSAAVVASFLTKYRLMGFAYLLMAMLVGYSRMYMSEHFFEDVFAGAVEGTLLTVIWLSITQKFAFLNREKLAAGIAS